MAKNILHHRLNHICHQPHFSSSSLMVWWKAKNTFILLNNTYMPSSNLRKSLKYSINVPHHQFFSSHQIKPTPSFNTTELFSKKHLKKNVGNLLQQLKNYSSEKYSLIWATQMQNSSRQYRSFWNLCSAATLIFIIISNQHEIVKIFELKKNKLRINTVWSYCLLFF